MKPHEFSTISALIRNQRQAALGTLQEGAPFVSMVAYAVEPNFDGFLLHLSQLAPHTKHIMIDPRTSLLICEQDDGREDVQTLARITLVGSTTMMRKDDLDYTAARLRYLDRLPAAEMLFSFGDFGLYRFVPNEARYIGGFAQAFTLTIDDLRAAADGKDDE